MIRFCIHCLVEANRYDAKVVSKAINETNRNVHSSRLPNLIYQNKKFFINNVLQGYIPSMLFINRQRNNNNN